MCEILTKTCSHCKLEKPTEGFSKDSSQGDGLQRVCKECHAAANKACGERNRAREVIVVPSSKVCSGCHVEKGESKFSKDRTSADGLRSCCKECNSKYEKDHQEQNKARENIVIPESKLCPLCQLVRPSSMFKENSSRTDGLRAYCNECDVARHKTSGEKNKAREVIVIPECKTCPGCETEKHEHGFGRCARNNDGLQTYCKECRRWTQIMLLYGLSPEQYNAMLEAQGYACAICRATKPGGVGTWHVDHIHGTDIVRGLLCSNCNLGTGHFRDSPEFLNKAIDYLNGPTTGIVYKKSWGANGVPAAIKNKILADQNGLCKICSVDLCDNVACLDHDHLTNMVRGYLCRSCNSGLGYFDDSVDILQNAINYLTKYSAIQQSIPADKPHLTRSNTSLPSSLPY